MTQGKQTHVEAWQCNVSARVEAPLGNSREVMGFGPEFGSGVFKRTNEIRAAPFSCGAWSL